MKRKSLKRPGPRGFTLVEILVVLAILVLLASLVVPRFMGTQKAADLKAAKLQIATFKSVLQRYSIDARTFPTTEQGLEALRERPSDPGDHVTWDGPYLDEIPKDPWGRDYEYGDD